MDRSGKKRVDCAPMKACLRIAVGSACLCGAACSPPAQGTLAALTLPPPVYRADGAPLITEDTRDAHIYALYVAEPGSPDREAIREALIRDTLERARRGFAENRSVDVRATMADALRLFDTSEIAAPLHSPAMAKLLDWIRPVARRNGKPEAYLLTAHSALLIDPADAAAAADIEEAVDWWIAVHGAAEDPSRRLEALVDLYDAVTEALPLPSLVKDLIEWTLQRHDLGRDVRRVETLEDMLEAGTIDQRFFSGLTIQILKYTARLGEPEATVGFMKPYRDEAGYLADLIDEIGGLRDPLLRANAAAELAAALEGAFPEEARRWCLHMRREYPDDGRFAACVGRYYYGRGETGVAARFMLEAASVDPEDRGVADAALTLLADEIDAGVDRASWAELQGLLTAFEATWARYGAIRPEAEPPVEAAAVLERMASAALVLGDVENARAYYERSLAARPTAWAYLEAGQMEWRDGNVERGLELLRAGLQAPAGGIAERTFTTPRIHEEIGRIHQALGDANGAAASYELAADAWRDLARSGTIPRPLSDVHVGRLDVLMGRREEGMARVARAIRTAPEQASGAVAGVYWTGFMFLHQEAATDLLAELFPLTVTSTELAPNDRVYFALWTLGAFRRRGLPDDPETRAFLAAIPATDWWLELARLYLGERSYDEVRQTARTPGQIAELDYYEAMNRFAQGDAEGGREMLQRVVDSRIYNYNEWILARAILDNLE